MDSRTPAKGRKKSKTTASTSSVKKSKRAKIAKTKRLDDLFDDVDEVLGPSSSPLYNSETVAIQNILKHPDSQPHTGSLSTELSGDNLSRVVAEFREDGASSRHDPAWLTSALEASRRRSEGVFDEYLDERFEEDWGEDSSDEDDDNDNGPSTGDMFFRGHPNNDDNGPDGDAGASAPSSGTNINSRTADSRHEPDAAHTESSGAEGSGSATKHRCVSVDELLLGFRNVAAPPRHHVCAQRSVAKLTCLVNIGPVVCGINRGDIIRYSGKDAVVDSQGHNFRISVPPGTHPHSEPHLRQDFQYPNNLVPKRISGPGDVAAAMHHQNPQISLSHNWRKFQLVRGGNVIGNLFDLRQAWQFALQEYQYQQQLLFKPNRLRRLKKTYLNSGFQVIDKVALYRKIHAVDHSRLNQDLVIDLGPTLNRLLAETAEPGFVIVMMDLRITTPDGIPRPDGRSLEEVYQNGPGAFPTTYLRALAGSHGYTNGHAHIGPLGLGKGFNNQHWGHARCLKGSSGLSESGPVAQGRRPPNEFFRISDPNYVGTDMDPVGVSWTPRERAAVSMLQRTKIEGKIAHYPIPVTMSRRCPELCPVQLSIQPEGRYAADDGSILVIDASNSVQRTMPAPPRHAATTAPTVPQSSYFDMERIEMGLPPISSREHRRSSASVPTVLAASHLCYRKKSLTPFGSRSRAAAGSARTCPIPLPLSSGLEGMSMDLPSALPNQIHIPSEWPHQQEDPDQFFSYSYRYPPPPGFHPESHDPSAYSSCPTLTSTDTNAEASEADTDMSMIDPFLLDPFNSFAVSTMSTPSLDYMTEPVGTNSLSSGGILGAPAIHDNSQEAYLIPTAAHRPLDENPTHHEHDTFDTSGLFGDNKYENESLQPGTPKPENVQNPTLHYGQPGYKRKVNGFF